MFNFFKKDNPAKELLVDQVIGGQSVLYKIFQDVFKEPAEEIKKKELTYFALAVLSYIYLRLSKSSSQEKETLTDHVALDVLIRSLPHSSENISTKEAIPEYQKRYKEYDALINLVFKENGFDNHSCITLLMHFYETAMGKSANQKMIEIYASSPLITQYIVDNIEFVKEKKLV